VQENDVFHPSANPAKPPLGRGTVFTGIVVSWREGSLENDVRSTRRVDDMPNDFVGRETDSLFPRIGVFCRVASLEQAKPLLLEHAPQVSKTYRNQSLDLEPVYNRHETQSQLDLSNKTPSHFSGTRLGQTD